MRLQFDILHSSSSFGKQKCFAEGHLRKPLGVVQLRRNVAVAVVQTPKTDEVVESFSDLPTVGANGDAAVSKLKVVVVGSGWASTAFIKSLTRDAAEKYSFSLLSPRNYFLYTPLLPAMAAGTMEERSIVEPVRRYTTGKARYYEALCKEIDPVKKELVACFPADAGLDEACFKLKYDLLILGVGSTNNTFGIQGVQENCYLFKTVEDANQLRRRVSECFERAALPYTDEARVRQLLSFVIVGGGPTGVEVAAELYDMITQDLVKLYPDIMPFVKIRVVELTSHLLGAYDRRISKYTEAQFKREGIDTVLNAKVTRVEHENVVVKHSDGREESIPFGACVWATGIAMNPLIKDLQQRIPGQTHFRSIMTDEYLQVVGSNGSIYAFGDAATQLQIKALEYADVLFEQADANQDGKLQYNEIRDLLLKAQQAFPHLEEHANFLLSREGRLRWGGMVADMLRNAMSRKGQAPQPLGDITTDVELSRDEFSSLLQKLDLGLRGLPATAQVAKQQGEYLASVFNAHNVTTDGPPAGAKEFSYQHKGSTAYVGKDRAVFDLPIGLPLTGLGAGYLWKSYESFAQLSWRNRILTFTDWIRTKVFGRDISRV